MELQTYMAKTEIQTGGRRHNGMYCTNRQQKQTFSGGRGNCIFLIGEQNARGLSSDTLKLSLWLRSARLSRHYDWVVTHLSRHYDWVVTHLICYKVRKVTSPSRLHQKPSTIDNHQQHISRYMMPCWLVERYHSSRACCLHLGSVKTAHVSIPRGPPWRWRHQGCPQVC